MVRSSAPLSTGTDAPKRAPRRRVSKAAVKAVVSESVTESVKTTTPRRKAPTRIQAETSERTESLRRSRIQIAIPTVLLVFGFGAAALIGYSDAGQINIGAVIAERNATITSVDSEGNPSGAVTIPVQNNISTVPDGGLKSSGAVPEPPPAPVDVVASSTEEIASSTVAIDEATTTEEVVVEDVPVAEVAEEPAI